MAFTPRDFVEACKREHDDLLRAFTDPAGSTLVAARLNAAGLDADQRARIVEIIDACLTDTFYTVLLALDGSGSLGGVQQIYELRDQTGTLISSSEDGDLESFAYEIFHGDD